MTTMRDMVKGHELGKAIEYLGGNWHYEHGEMMKYEAESATFCLWGGRHVIVTASSVTIGWDEGMAVRIARNADGRVVRGKGARSREVQLIADEAKLWLS